MKPNQSNDIVSLVDAWREQHEAIVLATGVFDILHPEHIRFLTKAKAVGDRLIVGLETDERVRAIKGPHRPIHAAVLRLEQIEALKVVDASFLLPAQFDAQKDWELLMQQVHPDIYAVSSHTSWLDNKLQVCNKFGVDLKIVHQFNPDSSTSQLEEKLRQEL